MWKNSKVRTGIDSDFPRCGTNSCVKSSKILLFAACVNMETFSAVHM